MYKGNYYRTINKYLKDGNISFKDLENYFMNKENIDKFKIVTLVENNNSKNNKRKIFNLMNLYTECKENLDKEINLLDTIITKYGEKGNTVVYRGITENKTRKNNFYKTIIKASKKKSNKIFIKNFQSTSLNINVAERFSSWGNSKKGILLEIETNGIPYFYLPWNIETGKLKKEKISGSEFELLLPRNIEMEYIGKKKIKTDRNMQKNWHNYDKDGHRLKDLYLYKFKITEIKEEKEKKEEEQDNIEIPLKLLKKLFYIN